MEQEKDDKKITEEDIERYISFRDQHLKCVEAGNLLEVPCIACDQIVLVCVKYKTYCNSGACRDKRFKGEDPLEE